VSGRLDGGKTIGQGVPRPVEVRRAGKFYIFTHPQMRPAFESRFHEIVAAQQA
jgi:hypothetical protein